MTTLGAPRLHLRRVASTNDRARALAQAGAPHGTLVTAAEQTAGHGRQGRTWSAPPGTALLCSLILREWDPFVTLAAAVAVGEIVGPAAGIKWPNDVLLDGRKVGGILVEGRPQEGWAVLGIGINVAVPLEDLPPGLRATAGTLGRPRADLEPTLTTLVRGLEAWLTAPHPAVLAAWRARDALRGREITWDGGTGRAAGIDAEGRLLVDTPTGTEALTAGEVHLGQQLAAEVPLRALD